MTLADVLRRQYGDEEGPFLAPMFWCRNCGCASQVRVMLPNRQSACPVCLYEAQRAHTAQHQEAAETESQPAPGALAPVPQYEEDVCAEQRRKYRYKRSERAFKDFLLEAKQELDEEEFVEMCRDYYQADW